MKARFAPDWIPPPLGLERSLVRWRRTTLARRCGVVHKSMEAEPQEEAAIAKVYMEAISRLSVPDRVRLAQDIWESLHLLQSNCQSARSRPR
jgi:hypothetical protein